jgi:hypothetical protein
MISYVLVTRNRHAELRHTVARLAALGAHAHDAAGGAELIVVDNASEPPVMLPAEIARGFATMVIRADENLHSAGRNVGVERARGEWIVMLDDDSSPIDAAFVGRLHAQPADVHAVCADITLPGRKRESGGLPEVPVGCGVAYRRGVFLGLGGYDASFGYYAEEYDLAAKLLLGGGRIVHEPAFRVEHRKVIAGRDMNQVLRRLVRNNAVVIHRYAPDDERGWLLDHTLERYGEIARREAATQGYEVGVRELEGALAGEPRTPMPGGLWRRFTGEAAAEAGARRLAGVGVRSPVFVGARGKHDWAIERALTRSGLQTTDDAGRAEAIIVGTLSPGPAIDADRSLRAQHPTKRVACLWSPVAGDADLGGRTHAA